MPLGLRPFTVPGRPPRAGEKKRKNKKKEKKNMPKMCTVVTHAERGAAEQRLCRAIRHVVLRLGAVVGHSLFDDCFA